VGCKTLTWSISIRRLLASIYYQFANKCHLIILVLLSSVAFDYGYHASFILLS